MDDEVVASGPKEVLSPGRNLVRSMGSFLGLNYGAITSEGIAPRRPTACIYPTGTSRLLFTTYIRSRYGG